MKKQRECSVVSIYKIIEMNKISTWIPSTHSKRKGKMGVCAPDRLSRELMNKHPPKFVRPDGLLESTNDKNKNVCAN